jgi:NAD(P)-dependent dehydrogenase (short-subunit alcohol dehydrogenase family)
MIEPILPNLGLKGHRAIVTGAGRGIGLAIAATLAAAGAEVTLCARSRAEVEAAVEDLRKVGLAAYAAIIDVTDIAAFEALISDDQPFDILVNNAGTNRPKPISKVTPADYDAVLDVNLRALYFASRAFAGRLQAARRPGSIINISSQMGHVGAANRTLYCASKWAVEGFTKALAVELGPHGIRVNTVAPTFVDTPMTRPMFEDATFLQSVLSKIKLGRLATPNDVTGAVLFLASDAAAMMTGSSMVIDGGWTAD